MYPQPWELEQYAAEPAVFTAVNDIRMDHEGHLVGGEENVEYRFKPTTIRVSPKRGEEEAYEASTRPDTDIDHAGVWTRKINTEVESETVTASTFTSQLVPHDEAAFVEAHWQLESVTITTP